MVLTEKDHCKRFRSGLICETRVYLVAQNTKLFDEIMEKVKAIEEHLAEPSHSIVVETSKKASDGAPRHRPNRGRDNYSFGRGARHGSQPSQSKQQSNVVTSTGGSGWLICAHYDRRHPEECHKLSGGYFKLGSKEHLLRDSPNRVEVSQTQSSAPVFAPINSCGYGRVKPVGYTDLCHTTSHTLCVRLYGAY
ncbi:hypothetical protein J1N35_043728 [Gossypium stocksii]|uniref:Uncharacterized protein n=1 Tax=Gossypium stocksii TaxID=47602 RepID=A0A9D3U7Y8_9ROSI|nr:hypothetical protein J1N35_043728 [Gossypium stocksii]